MTEEMMIRKNFELLEEFQRYGFEHPEIFDQIPKDAQLIILPENDPELLTANEQIVEKCKKENRRYVVFRLRIPERSTPQLVETA